MSINVQTFQAQHSLLNGNLASSFPTPILGETREVKEQFQRTSMFCYHLFCNQGSFHDLILQNAKYTSPDSAKNLNLST